MGVSDCVDLSQDDNNCGFCGNRCDFGLTCRNSQCQCGSFSNEVVCPGQLGSQTCVNLESDNDNCGFCGNRCDFGLTCRSGQCQCGSFSNEVVCPSQHGGQTCVSLESDNGNCGFCGNQCGFDCQCRSGLCGCIGDGEPPSEPSPSSPDYESEKCGFEVSWTLPWRLIADNSTTNWDAIAIEADINATQAVTVEIWGIPLAAGTSMDQALGSLDQSSAVTAEFTENFRNDHPDLQVVQQANGRMPMIIEYSDREGDWVREFIYGHITEGNRCAYVYLNRLIGLEFLPEEFREIEQNLKVGFGEVEASACNSGLTDCGGGQCVDLQSDVLNCGHCGSSCDGVPGPGQSSIGQCIDGQCQAACLEGADYCDEECTDLSIDVLNCGACGVECWEEQACCDGRCISEGDADRFCDFCGIQGGWRQGCRDDEECDGAICITRRAACDADEGDCANQPTSESNSFSIELGKRIAGPDLGILTESEKEMLISSAGVEVADFYATVHFVVPSEEFAPWDFTLGFRDIGGEDHFRLTIISDKSWTLSYGGADTIASGMLNSLLMTQGDEIRVELLARGSNGIFAVLGVQIAELSLADALEAGDIWLASASHVANTDVNRTTEYSKFEVFTLE